MLRLSFVLFWNCTNWGYLGDPLAGVSEGLGVGTRETLDRRSRTWACLRGGSVSCRLLDLRGGHFFRSSQGVSFDLSPDPPLEG